MQSIDKIDKIDTTLNNKIDKIDKNANVLNCILIPLGKIICWVEILPK
jgi:hypothetical protein